MSDAPIRSRLMVRLLGLLLMGFSVRYVVRAVAYFFREGRRYSNFDIGDWTVYFYSVPINLGSLLDWLVVYGVSVAIFLIGTVLVIRGSRRLERRVQRELIRA